MHWIRCGASKEPGHWMLQHPGWLALNCLDGWHT